MTQEEIFKILVKNPDKWFYTKKLTEKTGATNVGLKLNKLLKQGYVLRKYVKKGEFRSRLRVCMWMLK